MPDDFEIYLSTLGSDELRKCIRAYREARRAASDRKDHAAEIFAERRLNLARKAHAEWRRNRPAPP